MAANRSTTKADEATIRQSQADVLASRITPHPTFMQAAGITLDAADAQPVPRAVVWAQTAHETCIAKLRATPTLARAVAHDAARLGRAPSGAPGRLPETYETAVADMPYVLVFDLVTWTKAGEVIAILALADAPTSPLPETRLWAGRGLVVEVAQSAGHRLRDKRRL